MCVCVCVCVCRWVGGGRIGVCHTPDCWRDAWGRWVVASAPSVSVHPSPAARSGCGETAWQSWPATAWIPGINKQLQCKECLEYLVLTNSYSVRKGCLEYLVLTNSYSVRKGYLEYLVLTNSYSVKKGYHEYLVLTNSYSVRKERLEYLVVYKQLQCKEEMLSGTRFFSHYRITKKIKI